MDGFPFKAVLKTNLAISLLLAVSTKRSRFFPLVRRRAVAGVKRAFGEELSELATVYVFSHLSSEFFEPLFMPSSTGNAVRRDSLGPPSLWLLVSWRRKRK